MKITFSRQIFYQILFAICIAVPYLNNYELTFAVWIFVAFITISRSYSLGIIKQLVCFAAILAIALVVFLFKDYQLYYVVRDITYMLKPIIGLLIGYQICKRNFKMAFQTITTTGFIIAVIHLLVVAYAILFLKARTVNDIRFSGGFFSDFEVYALIVVLFHKKFQLNFSARKALVYSVILGLSVLLYLARTNFIQFFILFFGMIGYLKINRRALSVLIPLFLIALLGYGTILYINPRRNGPGLEAFLYKVKIIPFEAFKTKINRDDYKDFNDNYRSYENILTVRQSIHDGFASVVFGNGVGSKVDLKQEVWLGDMNLRYISILHNGFMTVFLKSGLLGLFIYFITIYLLFKQPKSEIPIIQTVNLLLLGTGVFLLFSNWVFLGVYNLLDNKSILIGTLICFKEMTAKNHNKSLPSND